MALALPALADVTTTLLDDLTLFSQYSAAAYCSSNLNSTGVAVACSVGNCPLVEAADTQILYDFDEYYFPHTHIHHHIYVEYSPLTFPPKIMQVRRRIRLHRCRQHQQPDRALVPR
jgi:hypothetical protein